MPPGTAQRAAGECGARAGGGHQRGQAAGHGQGQRGAGQGELLPLCGHPGPRSALLQCGPGLGGGEDGAAPGGGRLNEND